MEKTLSKELKCWRPNTGQILVNLDGVEFVCEKWQHTIILKSIETNKEYEYTYKQISDAMISRKIWFK